MTKPLRFAHENFEAKVHPFREAVTLHLKRRVRLGDASQNA